MELSKTIIGYNNTGKKIKRGDVVSTRQLKELKGGNE